MSFILGGSDGPTAVVVSSNSNLLWTDFIPVFLILAGGVALLVLLHLLYQRYRNRLQAITKQHLRHFAGAVRHFDGNLRKNSCFAGKIKEKTAKFFVKTLQIVIKSVYYKY